MKKRVFKNRQQFLAFIESNCIRTGKTIFKAKGKSLAEVLYFHRDVEGFYHVWLIKSNQEIVSFYNRMPEDSIITLLIYDDNFEKPFLLHEGDIVEILPSVTSVKHIYQETDGFAHVPDILIGQKCKIKDVNDTKYGVSYNLEIIKTNKRITVPNYCVKKINNDIISVSKNEIERKLGYKIKIIENEQ